MNHDAFARWVVLWVSAALSTLLGCTSAGVDSSESVAEVGVRMMETGAARRILPWTAAVLMAGFGWLPRPVYHTIARWFGVARSMAHWKGRS